MSTGDHALRDQLREPRGIDDEVVGGMESNRAVRGPSIGAGRYSFNVLPSTTTSGIRTSADTQGRPDTPGHADDHHPVELAEPEQSLGRARRERGTDPVVVATTSAFPTTPVCTFTPLICAGCRENAFTTERSSIFIGASTTDPNPIPVCHRPSLPQNRGRRARPARLGSERSLTGCDGRSPPTRVAGALVALGAAWLFPQRSDLGARLIIALLFAGGIGLMFLRPGTSHRMLRRVTATVLVVAFLVVGAYWGAETPSVHWFAAGSRTARPAPTRSRSPSTTVPTSPRRCGS
jgi:hypothetical protein